MATTTNTNTMDCETSYGTNFIACELDSGLECCFVGDEHDEQDQQQQTATQNYDAPIDCSKTFGERFEDCERDWGWDCCMKDDALDNLNSDQVSVSTAIQSESESAIDCFATYGERFQDCETALGRDCCYVGDEMDDMDDMDAIQQFEMLHISSPTTCSQELGPEFTDCGHGYGLDCCYVDDGMFKHDHEHANESGSNLTDSKALEHFDSFYQKQERKSCQEQFGANFTDCGNTYGLDCCYIDDGVLFYDHGGMHGMHGSSNAPNLNVFRWLVVMAIIAFVAIQRRSRFSSISRKRIGKSISRKMNHDDGDDNEYGMDGTEHDDEVELKPLI